ncbi:MAG TPA: cytochrome c peroxidase, partial [Planctomycetota bacterium]|nr:cytochrome c peroxidase [Planctomycetota bacterium]
MRSLLAAVLLTSVVSAQGLPPQPVPPQNPITPAKAVLGKLLFWEEQMSSNNRVACGTCHTFAAGGGDLRRVVNPGNDGVTPSPDDTFGSPGIIRSDAANDYLPDARFGLQTQVTRRAAPSFLLAAWFPEVFWDGRARTTFVDPDTGTTVIPTGGALENQALAPLLASDEMAHDARTFAHVTQKLATVRPMALASNLPADMANAVAGGATYPDLFAAAFGTPAITAQRIAFALATYQRTLVPNQTPYDLFLAGNPAAMTPQQQNGRNVFNGPGRCNLCHTPGLFSDGQFRNLGLRPIAEDNGRQAVTGNFADRGKFKVPSLRNVGLRGTLMHTGQFTNVGQVFGFYLGGGGPNLANKDPLLVPLNVPPQAANDLINFVVNALTDPRVAQGLPPFDRPTLRSQLLPPIGIQYGFGSPGTGGRVPNMLAEVPANLGNQDFKVGVGNGRGGSLATLLLGIAPTATMLGGVNLNVALTGQEILVPAALGG